MTMKARSTLALICAAVLLVCTCMQLKPVSVSAAAQENLISEAANPATGVIRYKIRVPAGKTVNYLVSLTPNRRVGTIERVGGQYINRTKHTVTKTITAKVKHLSDKYVISASYEAGLAKKKTVYADKDRITSKLKSTVYTSKFTWDAKNLKKWKNGKRIALAMTFAVTGSIDLFVSKGYLSGVVSTVIGLSVKLGNFVDSGDITSTRKITVNPIKGWGYRIKCVPCRDGYNQYLLVYNEKGKQTNSYKLGKIPVSCISMILK